MGNDTYALNGSARDSKRFIDLDRILDNRPGGIKADGSAIISQVWRSAIENTEIMQINRNA